MGKENNVGVNSENVNVLTDLIGEATRANIQTVKFFIEPASGTLSKILSARPHIVFGRRGSGKSSLLRKAQAELSTRRLPAAFVDLETFKSHAYPDVLLSVLLKTMDEYLNWIETAGTFPASKVSFWEKIFGKKPSASPIEKTQREEAKLLLQKTRGELDALLHTNDGIPVSSTITEKNSANETNTAEMSLGHAGITVGAEAAEEVSREKSTERSIQERISKTDYLNRSILNFEKIFSLLAKLGGGRAYLVLDDLYHLKKSDQANVLDYFHRVTKNTGTWLKIETIRHRTDHYKHGNPPVGMKLGDDADEIDLDLSLEKFVLAKEFLTKILDGFFANANISNRKEVVSDAAIERLVLASGGVARDFLTIFRKSIDFARERIAQAHSRKNESPVVGVEDVNKAAGDNDNFKREELRRDTDEDRIEIENAFEKVKDFCLDERSANCFLVERDTFPAKKRLLDELVDLKMLHLIKSRETVTDRKGKQFVGYMLDLSQYSGSRSRRNFDLIKFWDLNEKDKMRTSGFIFDISNL